MSAGAPGWFRAPAQRFRTAAFWFWHRIPTTREITDQLADMQAKGLGAVMIQARPALPLDHYLSPAYLAAYRVAAREVGRLGLGLTIYDEYGWMSGHGGGRTVAGADHLRERHLFWSCSAAGRTRTVLRVSNIRSPFLDFLGEVGRDWLYDGGLPRWDDWQAALVLAHPEEVAEEAAIRVLDGSLDLTAAGPAGCRFVVEHDTLPAGTIVTAFLSARCATSRLINYLKPEAARRFAETVYAPLLAAAEGAADGFFFDHPHAGFYAWDERAGPIGNSLLTDGTPVSAQDTAALLALTRTVGPRTAALRAGMLDRYAQRLHEAFFGTLSDWARERGLGFTGHELLTHVGGWTLHDGLGGFDPRTMPGTDYFGIDAFRTETTVDAADFAPQISAKFGDSVARAHGRTRCSVEQYATGRSAGRPTLAGRWDLTAAEFRAQAIRHLLLGARRIILHAVNVTAGGDGDDRLLVNPRFDFPPAYNFQPWWEDCPAVFDELARLSAFLEEGVPLRPAALLYPLETIQAAGPDHPCGTHFGWWAEALARAGIGYDVVDERRLAGLADGRTAYQDLILPSVEALASAATLDHLAGFVGHGGRLLASGRLPSSVRDPEGAVDAAAQLEARLSQAGMVHLADSDPAAVAACVARLPRPLPHVRFADDGPTWCAVACCDKTWRVAVFNDADRPRLLVTDAGRNDTTIELWDAATGALEGPQPARRGSTLSWTVGAQRLLCFTLQFGPGIAADAPPQPLYTSATLAPVVLDEGWTLELDGAGPTPIAVDRGWERQGWPTASGTGFYRRRVSLPPLPAGQAWSLHLPSVRDTAEVWVDGVVLGRHVAGEARFVLPHRDGAIGIELRVRNTAANRFYAGTPFDPAAPHPAGLTEPPMLVAGAQA